MNILVTNDDGIEAEGIKALVRALVKDHRIIVAAPDGERSGFGHYTSLKTPFKYEKIDLIEGADCYRLTGTPADCVKFGISYLADFDIELVISGINHGRNLGTDVLYSGTVGAAMEGLIGGLSSVAVSYGGRGGWNFDFAAGFVAKNIEALKKYSDAKHVININFPVCRPDEIKGVKVAPQGREKYNDQYIAYHVNGKQEGVILDGLPHVFADYPEDCDIMLNSQNYITITPLNLDLTDYQAIKNYKGDITL